MNRAELADFLRRARTRLAPSDVGLAAGSRRRTPGLRREEVAGLAGMSVDYYTRLEQRRGSHPSRQMLTALARALRLTADERDHLFHLAGEEPPRRGSSSGHVRPGLLLILDRLQDTPAQVLSDWGEVLAQNTMAVALSGDATGENLVRRYFLDPGVRALIPPEDYETHARAHVANLRAVSAARPDDPGPVSLVAELRGTSAEFERLWASHEVAVRRASTKRFLHPVVGLLDLDCEVLLSSGHDQQLVVHSARPGTQTYERLALLRVIGLQDLSPSER
ncbi:helix-turn-helix transcriptional regulator [Streptomyces sp. cg35]|uniref:helix-turn-helix transcriptional regulator n=1 Tax=Streptomyces sp. cg35 TaxID=3421650 RepID=UPI003D1747A7